MKRNLFNRPIVIIATGPYDDRTISKCNASGLVGCRFYSESNEVMKEWFNDRTIKVYLKPKKDTTEFYLTYVSTDGNALYYRITKDGIRFKYIKLCCSLLEQVVPNVYEDFKLYVKF